VLSPIVRDMPFVGFGAVKGRIVATDRFHLALQGSVGWGHAFNASDNDANVYTVGAGAFASYCLRQDCSSLASASATYSLGLTGSGDAPAHAVIYGGSVVHRVARHVKLLGEIASAAGGLGGRVRKPRRRAGRLRRPLSTPTPSPPTSAHAGHGRRHRRRLPCRRPVRNGSYRWGGLRGTKRRGYF
jgi:hypothetical protein